MPEVKNHLIEMLPRTERTNLLSICQTIELNFGEVLCKTGDPLRHVYFPLNSFISLVTNTDDHPGLEVGMIGREGMLGAHLALGVARTPLEGLVQGAGRAWRVDATAFKSLVMRSAPLKKVIDRYVYVLMSQLASSAACLRYHLIAPRLARWLLMTQDRALSENFRVTQEFLAYMLGIRRVSVTAAAGALQNAGLITYTRGNMSILNRSGLEETACSCYESDAEVYAKQLG